MTLGEILPSGMLPLLDLLVVSALCCGPFCFVLILSLWWVSGLNTTQFQVHVARV